MVKNIFLLLYSRQTSILSGALVIMATVILSKILGLIRFRLLAQIFSPNQIEIFLAALRLPEFIFSILILGALTVAFIPTFTESYESEGKEGAFEMARSVINIFLMVFVAVAAVLYIFAFPITANFIVPGWSMDRQQDQIIVSSLTQIILVGQVILVIGTLFIGILQSFQRFIIPAMASVFYNLGIIIGIVFLSSASGIASAAYGVIIGAFLHVAIQVPLVWSMGFRIKMPKKFFHNGVRDIIKLMSVRTIGLAAEQVNETVGVALASLVTIGSITYLTFAQQLQVVPIGLFGAALAQAALPVLSAEKARGRINEFKITLLTTLHQILFLTLPAASILIVIRIPVVRLVYGASQFDWVATVLTGQTLAYLAIGLSAQAVSLLFVRGFYALKDTKTPVIVSIIVVTLNIVLSIFFIKLLKQEVWSIGLANSISAITSSALLFIFLHYKIDKFNLKEVLGPFLKMLMATIIMGVALYIPIKILDQVIFDTTKTVNLIALTGLSSIFALSVYIGLVWFLKVKELQTFADLLKKAAKFQTTFRSKEVISSETDTI